MLSQSPGAHALSPLKAPVDNESVSLLHLLFSLHSHGLTHWLMSSDALRAIRALPQGSEKLKDKHSND